MSTLGNTVPEAVDLVFCTDYAASSCCTIDQDTEIKANFENNVYSLLGEEGCMKNLKSLICGWTCSDNQDQFLKILPLKDSVSNFTVYVSEEFTTQFWDSCKEACYNFPIGKKGSVQEMFGAYGDNAPVEFIKAFQSDNDPFYKEDATHPRLFYAPKMKDPDTDSWLDASVIPELRVYNASGTDFDGCVKPEESTAMIVGVSTVLVTLTAAFMLSIV